MVIFEAWLVGEAWLLPRECESPAPAIRKMEQAPTVAASKTLAEGNLIALQSGSNRK
jgi:hypothetical protein